MSASPFRAGRLLAALLLLGAAAVAARAQSILWVEYKGKPKPVVAVRNGFAIIKDGDKEESVQSLRSGLTPRDEFFPLFVSVRDLSVHTSHVDLMNTTSTINNEFHLTATFESAYELPEAFLVLELDTEAGRRIFFDNIGTIRPREPRHMRADIRVPEKLGEGHFLMHVFTQGLEVFHSEQPWQFREAKLDAMVRKRIQGATDAPVRPFVGPAPEYPKALRKSHTKGTATVKFHITRLGVVVDPAVQEASDPAFGEAALAAIRQWRFLPRVKGGQPVETEASMPFEFATPPEEKK